ncbi:AraC family transcriptional regulator [Pseudomaricurvus alkylphenolicus]|uniref:AraC family transcriptional regulator n=1 Tax=Pseudomaricurvus alkylphenolicus TaxID=1306991 RepID=UPI00141D84D7|nr:AraC family transcriptional regulator [Pseudomaricurvus alkylphenolicus]NIB44162.1 AraC family transcriptional regulator [Pseudomaricurvus alkylphenolicus]
MAIKNLTPAQMAHHIKAVRPALEMMRTLGFGPEACLEGTGLSLARLEDPDQGITQQQEYTFHRNLLRLSGDPLLGIKLGLSYRLESYGLFGYAVLSAQTVGEALQLASDYGALTFTHFCTERFEEGDVAGFAFSHNYPLPADLLQMFCDRDIVAVANSQVLLGLDDFNAIRVRLMHSAHEHLGAYRDYFECPVTLGHFRNEVLFDKELLSRPLPQRDMETSAYCREQCRKLLDKLSQQGTFICSVREALVATPGYFPSVEEVAEKLGFSVRTLRRHLDNEGSSYQKLLTEIRHQLALDYLATDVSVEQIAEMLGYSETGNFSHAFKRWQGVSPKQYRLQTR